MSRSPRFSGSQLLKASLIAGSSVLVLAVFVFTQQLINRLSHEVATAHGFRPQLQVFVEPGRLQPRDEGLPIRPGPALVLGGCDLEAKFEPCLGELLLDLTVDLGGPEARLRG